MYLFYFKIIRISGIGYRTLRYRIADITKLGHKGTKKNAYMQVDRLFLQKKWKSQLSLLSFPLIFTSNQSTTLDIQHALADPSNDPNLPCQLGDHNLQALSTSL